MLPEPYNRQFREFTANGIGWSEFVRSLEHEIKKKQ